jgi:hypothetical protein
MDVTIANSPMFKRMKRCNPEGFEGFVETYAEVMSTNQHIFPSPKLYERVKLAIRYLEQFTSDSKEQSIGNGSAHVDLSYSIGRAWKEIDGKAECDNVSVKDVTEEKDFLVEYLMVNRDVDSLLASLRIVLDVVSKLHEGRCRQYTTIEWGDGCGEHSWIFPYSMTREDILDILCSIGVEATNDRGQFDDNDWDCSGTVMLDNICIEYDGDNNRTIATQTFSTDI